MAPSPPAGSRSSSASGTGEAVRRVRIRLRPAWESLARSRSGPWSPSDELAGAGTRDSARQQRGDEGDSAQDLASWRDWRAPRGRLDRPSHTSPVSDTRIRTRYGGGRWFSHRSARRATVFEVDVRTRSTPAPGLRLALLAILFVMALTADTRIASAAPGGAEGVVAPPPAAGETPFDRQGMWIWYVRPLRGRQRRADRRPRQARRDRHPLHQGRRRAATSGASSTKPWSGPCTGAGWTSAPGSSSTATARSPRPGSAPPRSRRGADCLVIDAEGDYEGKYAAADRYIRALRGRIGAAFPLSLAAFPYVDYHPSFPYSVFFGPEGATVQPAADVLEGDRHLGPRRLRAHLPLQPALGRTRSTRSGRPTAAPAARTLQPLPPLRRAATAAWRRAGGTGRRRAAPAGRRWAPTIDGPVFGYRPVVSHPVLKRGSARRPGRLGAGAPARRGAAAAAGHRASSAGRPGRRSAPSRRARACRSTA